MVNYTKQDDISTILLNDGVMLSPTDTIWGLGCSLGSEKGVKRIYKIKKRDPSKPLILLVNNIDMLKHYVRKIHPRIETLLAHHIQPLTIIYPKSNNVPDYAVTGDTVAIRIIKHAFLESIIDELDQPLLSTSANVSGQPYPRSYKEISKRIVSDVDYIVDDVYESDNPSPSILARFDDKGNLLVLRE